ncbi:uncharacterized protein [Fopius arisanus]|uniref:Uncharacterized protein n=1 Tax=Fopius arisanus TaxID=64838 RepID=A0A9R1T124_9HYME|nr:PREDICTED: uncharacterized protein LOC105265353 [Fopius arisanus]
MEILQLSLVVIFLTLHGTASDRVAGAPNTISQLIDEISKISTAASGKYDKRWTKGEGIPENRLKIRPFARYGAPGAGASGLRRRKPQVHPNPWSHQPRKHTNDIPERLQLENSKLELPSPIRHVDFRDDDPIASQNNEPFQNNGANYLPPRNQKLPSLSVHVFQRPGPTHLPANHHKISDPQISDATLFLIKNAQALSQLYETPAMNMDYPPFNDNQRIRQSHLGDLQEVGPLKTLQDLQVPRITQTIVGGRSPVSNSLINKSPGPTKICGEDASKSHQLTPKELVFGRNWNHQATNYPSPGDISLSSIPTISPGLDLRQGNPTVFPYPQYTGIIPLVTHAQNYPITQGIPQDTSPTHFDLPIVPATPGVSDFRADYSSRPFQISGNVLSIFPSGTLQDSLASPYPGYPATTSGF